MFDSGGDGISDAQELLAPFDSAQGTRTYRIEYTDDLTTNEWHPLTDPIPGDGKPVLVIDPAGATRPQRFYRLRVEQP